MLSSDDDLLGRVGSRREGSDGDGNEHLRMGQRDHMTPQLRLGDEARDRGYEAADDQPVDVRTSGQAKARSGRQAGDAAQGRIAGLVDLAHAYAAVPGEVVQGR